MRLVTFVLLALLGVGGGIAWYELSRDDLRDAINAHWPPANPEQQRQTAIDTAFAALDAMSNPNVAAGTDVKTIESIAAEKVKDKGVTKLTLETDHQLLKVTLTFDITLKPGDVDTDAQKKEWLEKLKPHALGRVELSLGAAATMVTSPKRVLQVKLLPAFKSIHVEKLTIADSYDVTESGALLADLLDSFANNISGVFANDPILNAELPASVQDQFDLSGPIKINPGAHGDFKLSLSSKPISSPYGLGAAALLIDGGKVAVLAQISPIDNLPTPGTASRKTFNDLSSAFKVHMSDGLDLQSLPTGAWIAVAKELLARTSTNAFAQTQACLNGSGSIPKQSFGEKIPTPDPASIDCTPKKDCTPTRNCTPTRDCSSAIDCTPTRDCSAVKDCSGYKWYQAPDKARFELEKSAAKLDCERIKSTEKGTCEADKAAKKLDCERLKTQEKAQCETEKSTAKLACETEKTGLKAACESLKGAVDALHHTGNVGNFDGSVSGTGDLQICFREVSIANDFTSISMKLATTGSASLDTSFKFTPLDVAGHVLCQFPWTADKRIDVTIPNQSITANLFLVKAASSSQYQGQFKATPIKLHFEPSPLALILQNINFHLACPATSALVNGMTLDLSPFIPELLKDYTHTLDPMDFSFVPDIPEQPLFGRTIKPKLSDTPKALVASGSLAP